VKGGPRRGAARGAAGGGSRPAARLVYEDETILAYDKPEGLPVIAPDGSRAKCLLDIASEAVRRRNPKGRAAVVHRIDRDTSGIVVFARDARAKRLLMSGWDELVAERLYLALVEGSMGASEGVLDSWLVEDERGFVREAGPRERGAKRAVTNWRVRSEGGAYSLLELRLDTGRKHQIRVQLAAAGHPVVGDPRYGRGGRGFRAGDARERRDDRGRGADSGGRVPDRLCLHAAAIELRLPGSGEALRIESPVPREFEAAISGVRRAAPPTVPRAAPPARGPERGEERGGGAAPRGKAAPDRSRRGEYRGPERGRGGPPLSAPYGGASSSRSAARSGAPRTRGAPRPKKPSSRT
jgi:23S rRNA pseudouridine1911/1915/1917 synthase